MENILEFIKINISNISMKVLMAYLLKAIIPIIIVAVIIYGVKKKVKVYECFVEGAKDGLTICLKIFPYLLAMIVAVNIFRASGALNYFIKIVSPIVKVVGLPAELVPLVIIKPLSGSGAIGIFTDVIRQHGADTYIGLVASIIMGSTETIFYTLTVYYGAVNVKKIRHTLWAAILADITAILMALTLAKFIM